jgi:hypothetical protein
MAKSYFNLTILSLSLLSCNQKVDETVAIKTVLEKESATWRAGDMKGHAACWHIQPYSKILISTTEGVMIDVPPAIMITPTTMGDGGTSANSNYQFSVHGNSAWVSHDEISTSKDGKNTYSHEIRMLEKIDGQWKIVGQSIHQYKPK